jgi:iron-sulfur cluster repair protein YtfE (RIC family)
VQELCRALQAFDADLTRHVELEDKILFPRAVAMEKEAAGPG